MLAAVPMVRLRIQAPAADAARVAQCVAAAGLLHLVDIAHGRFDRDASPPGARDLLASYRDLARRCRRVAERLGIRLGEVSGELAIEAAADLVEERGWLEARLSPIERKLEERWKSAAAAREQGARARDALRDVSRFSRTGLLLDRLLSLKFATVRFGSAAPEDLETLSAVLSPAAHAIVPIETEGAHVLAAVAVPSSNEGSLQAAFRSVAFEPVILPRNADAGDQLTSELHAAEEEERRLRVEIETESEAKKEELAAISQRAELGVLLLQAETCFAAAGRFVVVSGWIPEEATDRIRQALEKATAGRALVEVERPEELSEAAAGALGVPILYRNPIFLRPFQRLVELYGTPSYREVEPTAFFAASFLLMFGLMFGDVGHGLVLFCAGYCLFRYLPHYLDYGILLMEVGSASMLFGFLYGSFFGVEGLLPVIWMEPLRDLPRFMTVAVVMGVVLISGGLLLNVRNAWRAGEKGAALFGPHGLLGAFLYWVLVGLVARAFLPADSFVPTWILVSLLAAAVAVLTFKGPIVRRLDKSGRGARNHLGHTPVLLTFLEAAVEIVDTLVSYFANTVSFLRVAAFAAVHAGAFLAVFALADTLRGLRLGGILSVLALVAGNAVVILLEGLTVSVQVLRLEYYEFFGKFFRGGGVPYRPLSLSSAPNRGDT